MNLSRNSFRKFAIKKLHFLEFRKNYIAIFCSFVHQ